MARFARQTERSGGQKGRGVGGKEFLPALAFRRRRISYFALRNALPITLIQTNTELCRKVIIQQSLNFDT